MDTSLKKVLYLRYKSILIFLAILIFGIYFFQTFSGITSWKSNYNYFESEKSVLDFQKQVDDSYEFNDSQSGKILLYYDLKKDKAIYTDKFDKYKDYSLIIFNPTSDANQLSFNSYIYYNEHFLMLMILFITTGVLLFLFDLRSQFTAALFSSKLNRSNIYWQKLLLVGGVLGGSLLSAKLLSLLAYRFFIPSNYLNISLSQHLLSTLSGWLTLLAIFILSSFIGLLFGEWLFGIGTIVVLYLTFSSFLSNIDLIYNTIFVDESIVPSTVSNTALNNVLPLAQTSIQKINMVPLIIIFLLAMLALFFGCRIFNAISLEKIGDFIIVPQFSRILQVMFIFYGMIISTSSSILMTIYPGEQLSLSEISLNILKVLAYLVAYYLASEFLLFNKKSKIIKKINIFQ